MIFDDKERNGGRESGKSPGRSEGMRKDGGKCDVRLDAREERMLNYLAERNGVTRSDVMRRALKNEYLYNTGK